MVLCRVIVGNMELLHPGTRQFRPSSTHYDSGVDDIESPRYYIVWNMNVNTHIYPEFVVSFKVSSNAEGDSLFLQFSFVSAVFFNVFRREIRTCSLLYNIIWYVVLKELIGV